MYVKNKRTGEIRIGCDAEVGRPGTLHHGCGRTPIIKRTLEFRFEGLPAWTYLYYCPDHEKRAYVPAAACYTRFSVDRL